MREAVQGSSQSLSTPAVNRDTPSISGRDYTEELREGGLEFEFPLKYGNQIINRGVVKVQLQRVLEAEKDIDIGKSTDRLEYSASQG